MPIPLFFYSNSWNRSYHLTWITNAFSYIFVSIQFVKKDLIQRIILKNQKKEVHFIKIQTLTKVAQKRNFDSVRSGTEGFEPPNTGTKTRCLTTWPRPISIYISVLINTNIGIGCSSIPVQIPKIREWFQCQDFDTRRCNVQI